MQASMETNPEANVMKAVVEELGKEHLAAYYNYMQKMATKVGLEEPKLSMVVEQNSLKIGCVGIRGYACKNDCCSGLYCVPTMLGFSVCM